MDKYVNLSKHSVGHTLNIQENQFIEKPSLCQVRKFLREAEENGESEDLNGKGAGPADDKCFLCQKVILMLILIMLMEVIMQ